MNITIQGRVGKRMEETSGYGKIARQLGELLPHDGDTVNLWVSPPYDRKLPDNTFNAILTMHETDELPESKSTWVTNLNQYDLVIVPSQWNKDNFLKFGVTVPIEVVPLGVDPSVFKSKKTKLFSILTMHDNFGRESSRENWEETLIAYIKTFKGYKDTILYIKTWNYAEGALDTVVNRICKEKGIHRDLVPMIKILDKIYSDHDLASLIQSMWLFVKNANREGWSLPLNEAISCGVKSIYRNIPTLKWANGTGAISFNTIDEMKALMISHYYLNYRVEKNHTKRYDITNSAKAIAKYIQHYYDLAK